MYTFSKQLWGLHSPSTCLVQNFQIFTGDNFFHTYTLHTCFKIHSPYSYLVYTLQAHVRLKNFKFSREINFSCLHSPHMFQGTLSIQLFGLHSPNTCYVQNFWIFTEVNFFYTYTLHTCFKVHSPYSFLVYTLQDMLGSTFSNFLRRSLFHAYTLHTCFRVHSPYSYLVYSLQAHVRFNIFGFSQDFYFFILALYTHVSEFTLHAVVFTLSKQMLHFKFL